MIKERRLVYAEPLRCQASITKRKSRSYNNRVNIYEPTRYKASNLAYPKLPIHGNLVNSTADVTDDSLQNLIPELKKILNPHLNIYKRLFWTVAVLACGALCVYQFQQRVQYYLSNPVTTDISVSRTQTVNFPAVTICPSKPLALQNISEYLGYYKDNSGKKPEAFYNRPFDYFNKTLESVWNACTLPDNAVKIGIPCMAANSTVNCDGNDMTTFETHADYMQTLLGNCTVLTPIHDLEYQGPNTYLYFEVKPPSCNYSTNSLLTDIQIFIHSPGIQLVHDAVFMAEYMYKEYRTKIRFVISEFTNLNRSDKICTDQKTNLKCRNQCIFEKLHQLPGIICRLPFMAKIPASKLHACQTVSDATKSYEVARKFYTDMKTGDCSCNENCIDVMYRLSVDVEGHTKTGNTEFILYYADNLKETISECYAYSFSALVSDIGGSMGFFLGICCLSVLQIVEKFFETMLNTLFCKPTTAKRLARPNVY